MNTLIFIAWTLAALSILLFAWRVFGDIGVIAMFAGGVILMNIAVTKSTTIFGLGATGGNVLYAMLFLGTDLLSEFSGARRARQAVFAGFLVSVFGLLALGVTLALSPAAWDTAHGAMATLFTPVARITIGSLVAYLIAQTFDTYAYDFLKQRKLPMWIRNNGSTWTSQLIDTLVFVSLALAGTMPITVLAEIALSTYLLKIVVAAIDTPFMYLARGIHSRSGLAEA
nr:membrane protein [Spirochaetaceae bacterium]